MDLLPTVLRQKLSCGSRYSVFVAGGPTPIMDKIVLTSKTSSLAVPGLVPMRLVATMDIDNTGPNCVPRLCTLQITRVVVVVANKRRLLDSTNDFTFVLAVKMQGIRRVMRSNEIPVDAELDVTFEFAYPHYLKPRGNKLEVMLQRRKRHRHRPAMGFKTAASGSIDMAQILQRPSETGHRLALLSEGKEPSEVLAELVVGALASHPLEDEDSRPRSRSGRRKSKIFLGASDPSPDDVDDDDDDFDDDDIDDGGSDSDGGAQATARGVAKHRSSSNLKQRFAALLRKFKVSEDEVLEGVDPVDPADSLEKKEIEEIFNELEECYPSDSDADDDDESVMSVLSTPRPTLRPFFSDGGGAGEAGAVWGGKGGGGGERSVGIGGRKQSLLPADGQRDSSANNYCDN